MTVKLEISDPQGEMKTLLESVKDGNEVVISSGGKVVARVSPVVGGRVDRSQIFGAMKGKIVMADDFDTLPEEELERWYK